MRERPSTQLGALQRSTNQADTSLDVSDEENESQPYRLDARSNTDDRASNSAKQRVSQNFERNPPASADSDAVEQVDEFSKLKEMMDVEAALHTEYWHQLAKADALKQQLEQQRDAIRQTMAETVAVRSG